MPTKIMKFSHRSIKYSDLVWELPRKIRWWCSLPYPDHPNGCPNSKDCRFYYKDLRRLFALSGGIHLVWVDFDIDAWAASMKKEHPGWTDRQCRNLLYWQFSVRNELRMRSSENYPGTRLILGAEGGGINFYRTMNRLGLRLDRMSDLHTVRVIGILVDGGLGRFA